MPRHHGQRSGNDGRTQQARRLAALVADTATLEEFIKVSLRAQGACTPDAMVRRVHKHFSKSLPPRQIRYTLDWLASYDLIKRKPPELVSEPDYYWVDPTS